MTEQATFDEVLDAVESWPLDQQADFLQVIQRRLAEHGRKQIVQDVNDARSEPSQGIAKAGTVQAVMGELDS